MKMSKKWLFGVAAASLALSLAGCTNDDKKQDEGPVTGVEDVSGACKGDECAAKQTDADTKMQSCDFAAAYESINAVYLGQVASKQINPQTALDRSILGIIHLAYRDDVQKLLPKLGFTATGGVVDFKPLWNMSGGLFEQVFNVTHDYDDIADKIPMRVINEEVDYLDTIDKNLSFEDVLDVLVALKPDLESIAGSLAAAASATSALSPSSSIGCGLNKFQVDAADLNFMAAVLYAADAMIDLLAQYDFNFKIYDYYKTEQTIWNSDEMEVDRCTREIDNNGAVSTSCEITTGKDYTTLECYEFVDDEEEPAPSNTQVCFIPEEDSEDFVARTKMVEMLNPHLFKKTAKTRKDTGLNGLNAFQNAASHVLKMLDGSAKGKFFDFSAIPAQVSNEIKDIASKVANVSVDMSQYIKPSLVIDLSKVFTKVLYRTEDLRVNPLRYTSDLEVDGFDFVRHVIGDEIFFTKELLNHITNNANLISSRTYAYGYCYGGDETCEDYIRIEFEASDKLDATFSSSWDDFDVDNWLNPHEYFGFECQDDDYCEEKCPNEEASVYHRDSSKAEGYYCDNCWDKCEGDTPYCVDTIFSYYRGLCAKSATPCAEGQQVDETGECVSVEGRQGSGACYSLPKIGTYDYYDDLYVHYDSEEHQYYCSACESACSGNKSHCALADESFGYGGRYFVCAEADACAYPLIMNLDGECVSSEGDEP